MQVADVMTGEEADMSWTGTHDHCIGEILLIIVQRYRVMISFPKNPAKMLIIVLHKIIIS